jgi:hypothetical protein
MLGKKDAANMVFFVSSSVMDVYAVLGRKEDVHIIVTSLLHAGFGYG